MSQFWFWLLAPGGATFLVVRVVRHPGFAISVVLLLLVAGCYVITRPAESGKAVHDLFSDSSSAPTPPATTTTAVTTPARHVVTGEPLPAWECPDGDGCFWTGPDGTGDRCNWDGDDPDWNSGKVRCSWSDDTEVRSVFNNSDPGTVLSYFADADFRDRVGCAEPGQRTNLPAAAPVRSHKWIDSRCA